ncbi:MAG TPA: ABC transporter permease [Gaiellales bacterium]|nr:ABC transporter permease [Gaiellales bacterium]
MIGPVARLTLRALLRQRRTSVLVVIVAAPVLMSLAFALARSHTGSGRDFYSALVQQLFIPTVVSLVSLVFGVSAFGDEREDGTILYLAATPQPRAALAAAKVAAAWLASLCLLVPSLVLSALLVLGSGTRLGLVGWPLLGAAVASLAYCAASVWLSLHTRRPIVVGILYILLWEGSIATFAASAAKLSIAAYGRALVAQSLPQAARPVAGPATAVVVLAAVVAVAGWAAARSLRRVELP